MKDRGHRPLGYFSCCQCDDHQDMRENGFTRDDLISKNLRLSVTNHGAIYMKGKTPTIELQKEGHNHWMSLSEVEKL